MANSYFSFKQFTVNQDKCAMKVCTDACLFGAWSARLISKYRPETKNILDIGTGTGLLSLMLAQKIDASIDAVEIDHAAAAQAVENILASPWKDVKVLNIPIADFQSDTRYDLIISNPPFYKGSLLSPIEDRNAAMHDRYLTLDTLLNSIMEFISDQGYAAVLLPFSRETDFLQLLSKHNLKFIELTRVRQSVNHGFFRSMFFISLKDGEKFASELSIHDEERQYTNEFKRLLQDYYLNL